MSKSLDQVPGNSPRIHGKLYAFLIAFISALGGFLFGYDLAIIGGANVFLEKQFHLSPAEFGLISASAVLGCIIGPFLGAWSCDRFGRRSTLMGACWFLALGSIFTAVPQWLWPGQEMVIFFIFRVVGGLGVGLCSIASPMYTNEIAPARWRGGLGFMYQLAIVVGSVAASLAAWLLAGWLLPEVSWQWMFASELIFVGLFAVLLFLVPESPRWLAERQRIEEAQAIFARIDGPAFARAELVQVEQSLAAESGTLAELFGPSLRIALVVGLCLALFNNYTGWSAMAGYLTKLFELGGLSRSAALGYNLLAWGFMSLATLLACRLVDRVGRRPLWLISSLVMIAANAFLGLLFAMKASVSLLLAAVCFCAIPHSFALGPLPWLMMSEIFPTRIRARAVAITTSFVWLVNFVAGSLFPVLAKYSEDTIGSVAGVFWFHGAVCVFAFLFGLTLLPETKGRTLEEIGDSWGKGAAPKG